MQLVSVIIPVYNVEQYLPKCLDSVCNQTYKDIEIICVNDCSPDGCAKILQEYAAKDDRIKIINHQQNGGLSAARNSGLKIAAGEYIYFIDSDDWIDTDYLEKMIEAIKFANTDFVVNLNAVFVKNNVAEKQIFNRDYIKLSQNGFLNTKLVVDSEPWAVWINLYKSSFIKENHLKFPEGYVNEDVYFHYLAYLSTDKLYVFEGPNYYYNVRQGSISNANNANLRGLKIAEHLYQHLKERNLINERHLKLYLPVIETEKSEDIYNAVKAFLQKVLADITAEQARYTEYDMFTINMFLHTQNFAEYQAKYGQKAIRLCFLKSKILTGAKNA